MISAEQALEKIFESLQTLPAEESTLESAVQRVLAEEVYAECNLPMFDHSAMDGYAVRTGDLIGASKGAPVVLATGELIKAAPGMPRSLLPGQAIPIMTGAPIPDGADAVVMRELTALQGDQLVELYHAPKPGEHIRRTGEDVQQGDRLLQRGVTLKAYDIALLAAQGRSIIRVIRRPEVAVLATGTELVPFTVAPGPGQIRNTNGPSVLAALRRWDVHAVDLGIAGDTYRDLQPKFQSALAKCDCLLATGGVSIGDYDLTRKLLEELGVTPVYWKVAIKPGKPLFFGIHQRNNRQTAVFGLPGNPVAALVCLEEFVRPALECMRGRRLQHPAYHLRGCAVNTYPASPDRQVYLFCRARHNGESFELEIIRPQGAAMIAMASSANALARVPPTGGGVHPGMELEFRWLK